MSILTKESWDEIENYRREEMAEGEAIDIVEAGKHTLVNVKWHGNSASWNPKEDIGYCRYLSAKRYLKSRMPPEDTP